MHFSYWEVRGTLEANDVVVVGAGIVGLTAATAWKRAMPRASVLVVDSDAFSGGGTTRNAGFACFGSPSELAADREVLGDARALELVRMRVEGLEMLRNRFGDEALGYVGCGSHELLGVEGGSGPGPGPGGGDGWTAARLDELNDWIAPVTGSGRAFEWREPRDVARRLGVDADRVGGLIAIPAEGALETDRLAAALEGEARAAGVKIVRGIRVAWVEPGAAGVRWHAHRSGTPPSEGTTCAAGTLLVANNAFAGQLLGDSGLQVPDVAPIANRVLVTHPIPGWTTEGTFHAESGYLYARAIGNRLLVGGGRHWVPDGRDHDARLLEWAGRVWPGVRSATPSYAWNGTLGIGAAREPILTTWAPGIHVAVRLGGMGVAIGTALGESLVGHALSHP